MTTDTPAAELRAAAELLREAASHATPGPWRTHDTHLGGTGGHTATVLTDRPNINDTDLVAWLPTMSHEPWDEARNAWRNAGWMALIDPSVGLALADWLEQAAKAHDATIIGAASVWRRPEEAAERDAWVAKQTDHAALVVARRILGTTEQADTETAPGVEAHPTLTEHCEHDGEPWPCRVIRVTTAVYEQPTPAPAEETKPEVVVERPETDEEREQREDREETERLHAAGDHRYCDITCEPGYPSDMLRNGILCRAIPGSPAMLDELLRRAATPAP